MAADLERAGKRHAVITGVVEGGDPQVQAEIYMKIDHLPLVTTITDEQLHLMEDRFGIKAWEGWLD